MKDGKDHEALAVLDLARNWFDTRTVETVFEPLVADWEHERRSGATAPARLYADLRGWLALVSTIVQCAPRLLFSPTQGVGVENGALLCWWFLEVGVLVQLAVVAAGMYVAGVPASLPLGAIAWLLPSIGVLAAILLLVPIAQRLRAPGPQPARIALLQLALLATLGVAVASQWLIPASNQRFRIDTSRAMGIAEPARGARELSLTELFGTDAAQRYAIDPDAVRVERHARVAILVLPAVLTCFGWRRRRTTTPTSLAAMCVHWAAALLLIEGVYLAATSAQWPVRAHLIAVWLPIVVLTATAVRGKSDTAWDSAPASRRV